MPLRAIARRLTRLHGIDPRLQRFDLRGASGQKRSADAYLIADKIGETEVGISVVTLIELAHGAARADAPERRANRQNFIAELLTAMPIHPVCLLRFAPGSSTARTKREEYEFHFPIS